MEEEDFFGVVYSHKSAPFPEPLSYSYLLMSWTVFKVCLLVVKMHEAGTEPLALTIRFDFLATVIGIILDPNYRVSHFVEEIP